VEDHNTALKQAFEEQHAIGEVRLRNELNTALDARVKALDESATAKLSESESRIGLTVDRKIAASANSVGTQADASAKALIDARLAGLPVQVRATTAEMIAGLRAEVVGELSVNLTRDTQTRFTALESALNTRLGAMEGRLVGFEGQIPTLVAGSVDAARESLETTLNQQLDGRMEAARAALEESLSGQVKSVVADAVGDLDGRIVASLDQRLTGLGEAIAKSVTAATRNLPEQIGAEVKRQIVSLDLSGQIGAANSSLAQQLRAEQAAALAQQQAKLSEAINGSVTLLRGEISALRTEVNNTVDTQIKQSNLSLQENFSTQLKGLEGRLKPDVFRPTIVRPVTPIR
jgi:hypothetical protein